MNNSESFQQTEYKLGLVMSLNSFTAVRLWMCSQPLLELELFGETWGGSCESQRPGACVFVADDYPSLPRGDNYSAVTQR